MSGKETDIMERAVIGIDGNAGYALLGENLQEGEAEFVVVPAPDGTRNKSERERCAATQALRALETRLGRRLGYALDPSHPMFC